jgi:hypothetical protein
MQLLLQWCFFRVYNNMEGSRNLYLHASTVAVTTDG